MIKYEYTDAEYFYGPDNKPASIVCKLNGNTICVPLDQENFDYARITKLVEEGKLTIKENKEK